VVAGPWLRETLKGLRSPEGLARIDPGAALNADAAALPAGGSALALSHRENSASGRASPTTWGLARRCRCFSLLLVLKRQAAGQRQPSLLVAPASLLANWASEIERFCARFEGFHRASVRASGRRAQDRCAGTAARGRPGNHQLRLAAPRAVDRRNHLAACRPGRGAGHQEPEAKQTRTVKKLKSDVRLALTGTPIENRLGDLWSIFDFVNPGLLGSSKEFAGFVKGLAERPHNSYGPLRELVRPYILRRLKTDKSVIADLPDKTEMKTFLPAQPQSRRPSMSSR